MQLQNHPKVVYWERVDTHFPSPPPHAYPTSGTFRFFFLNGNTVNFAMAKTSMWRSHGFSVWITLRLICFTFGLYFLCNAFYCFALPFKYLYHHWELSKLYFFNCKNNTWLVKKKEKKIRDFPSGPVEEILPFHCRDPGFHPWQLGSCMTHSSSKKKKKIKSTPHPYPTSGAPSVLPYASCLGVTVVCLKEFFFNWWIILNIKFCKCSYTFKAWNIREKKVQIFLCSIWSLATSLQTPPHLHIFFFFFFLAHTTQLDGS